MSSKFFSWVICKDSVSLFSWVNLLILSLGRKLSVSFYSCNRVFRLVSSFWILLCIIVITFSVLFPCVLSFASPCLIPSGNVYVFSVVCLFYFTKSIISQWIIKMWNMNMLKEWYTVQHTQQYHTTVSYNSFIFGTLIFKADFIHKIHT